MHERPQCHDTDGNYQRREAPFAYISRIRGERLERAARMTVSVTTDGALTPPQVREHVS